ncbi:MAG: NUDIX domain-containing protein [Gammaproteobacteria bacterium]|nr:NUDIX domain-containing protein [Gammaproteobacteria bacterium]
MKTLKQAAVTSVFLFNLILSPCFSYQISQTPTKDVRAASTVITVHDHYTDHYYGFIISAISKAPNNYLDELKTPGGYISYSDRTVEAAAIRELKEETGLDINQLPDQVELDGDIKIMGKNRYSFVHIPLQIQNISNFLNKFAIQEDSIDTQELSGGVAYLINEKILYDYRLRSGVEHLNINPSYYNNFSNNSFIYKINSDSPFSKQSIINKIKNMQKNGSAMTKSQIANLLQKYNITSINKLKAEPITVLNDFITELLLENSDYLPFKQANRIHILNALHIHKHELCL